MSVEEKKVTKFLVSINNIDDIKEYKKVGITTFLFALKDYSIGYKDYSIEEINSINEKKYVLINRVLNTKEIDDLKLIISKLNVDGIIFEDVGLINVLKEYKLEKILFINHFNTNSESINCWLEYVDSVVLSNELTFDEYKYIVSKVNKEVIINIFGYNQIMYSKRKLLSNYNEQFNLDNTYSNEIKDQNSDVKFKILEQNNETLILSNNIFDGRRLLSLSNIKYYYLNTSLIDTSVVLDFINNKEIKNSDEGFLDKMSYYKLKGEKK
ncbi:MAG: U32 family peptidase [Bacilli bacterium]|nr:U32 family peptidase [Bacilli bacterium]